MTKNNHKLYGHTKGARRATGVGSYNLWRRWSAHLIVKFINRDSINADGEFLSFNMDSTNDVFVSGLGGQQESLSKDVQQAVASDEADKVVPPRARFWQWVGRGVGRFGEPNFATTLLQRRLRSSALELGIPITAIVLLFKGERLSQQILFCIHRYPVQESGSEVIIKFLNHSVAPRLGHWNEPWFHTGQQAKADHCAHTARVSATAIKDCLIIYLLVLRNPQTQPNRPDSVHRALAGLVQNWMDCTSPSGQINAIQAVESCRSFQVAWPYIIHLMNLVHAFPNKFGIDFTLWLIAACPPVSQFLPAQNAIDRSDRGQRPHPKFLQFPGDRLSSAKYSLVIQTQSNQFHRFYYVPRRFARPALRTRRPVNTSVLLIVASFVSSDPFINPLPRMPHRFCYRPWLFLLQIALDSYHPFFLLFLLHRCLLCLQGTYCDLQSSILGKIYPFNCQRRHGISSCQQRRGTCHLAIKSMTAGGGKMIAIANDLSAAKYRRLLGRILPRLPKTEEEN